MINFEKLYDIFINSNAGFQRLFLRGKALWPIHVSVELNYACNLRCKMCYHLNELSRPEGLKYIDMVNIYSKLPRNVLVSFTGGEVFLNKDIFKIIEYTSKRYNFSITTNGILLDQKTADLLLEHSSKGIFKKGLLEVGVSFQGPPEAYENITGSKEIYYTVKENIKYLTQEKKRRKLKYPLVDLRITVQKENIPFLIDIYGIAKEIGVDHCNFAIMDTWKIYNREYKDYEPLKAMNPPYIEGVDADLLASQLISLKKLEKKGAPPSIRFTPSGISMQDFTDYYRNRQDLAGYDCPALWANILIAPSGDVVICRDMVLGNLLENDISLSEVLNYSQAVDIRREVMDKGLFPMCTGCCALEKKRKVS